jgi:molybdenum cofactor cytidylyltransferase
MPAPLLSGFRQIDAVILAAGGSARLGRPKQLVQYKRKPLLLRTVHLARESTGGRIIVVLGAGQQRLRSLLRRRACKVDIVSNSDWPAGLASSLRSGLNRVSPTASAALILLVDQARLTAPDIARLIRSWRKRPTIPAAACYEGKIGAPAVIPRRWFGEARSLQGDVGARALLRRLGEVSSVGMPTAGFDVDTEAEAAALGS